MSTSNDVGERFADFIRLIARLRAPGGCPWDREQTHHSLKPMTIEEAYEVIEAIDSGEDEALAGELGDLLLQVVFHSQIAAETSRFDVGDVIELIAQKMVRRHPHVFAEQTAETPGAVLKQWEAIKRSELEAKGVLPENASMLDSVSRNLPAVMEAYQLTTKVSRVGFDWPDVPAVLAKLDEEVAELKQVTAEPARAQEELGDLLFAAVGVARLLGIDPESALKAANRKFRRRFRHIETGLRERGKSPAESDLSEMDALWEDAKAQEAR